MELPKLTKQGGMECKDIIESMGLSDFSFAMTEVGVKVFLV